MPSKVRQNSYYISSLLYNKNKAQTFLEIPVKKRADLVLKLSTHLKKQILKDLTDKQILSFLIFLDPDQATDLLQLLNEKRRKQIILLLNQDIKEKVDFLLKFNPTSAAGLMDLNYIQIEPNTKLNKIVELTEKHEKRTGVFPIILIVDNGNILGELPGYKLAFFKKTDTAIKHIKKIPTIVYNLHEKETISVFKKNPHQKVVVVNETGGILGVIHADDILGVIERKNTQTLYNFAGVNKEEDILDPVNIKINNRYKWLIVNLGTAFLAAGVVSLFEDTIQKYVILAAFLPIIAGMGGNAGTQAMAVAVRGLAMHEINLKTAKKIILNEVEAGSVNGTINGIILAIFAYFYTNNIMLTAVLLVSMIISLINAAFFGTLIPIMLKKFKKDPATSASIFITTTTDIVGFLALLGLSKIFL